MPVTESLDSTALVTREDARSRIKGGNDNDLILDINAASLLLENFTKGTMFIQRTVTEDYSGGPSEFTRGGAKRLWLRHGPAVSITSITDDNSDTIASTEYTLVTEGSRSYLEHETTWPAPDGRWTVIYVAGHFASLSVVTWEVRRACIMETARLFKGDGVSGNTATSLSGRAGSRSRKRSPSVVETAGLLPATRALLAQYIRVSF